MLELVRQQERELPVAAGTENEVLSCESMLRWERHRHNKLGKYIESINHSVSTEVKSMHGFMRISGDYKSKGLARRKQRKYSIKGIELN